MCPVIADALQNCKFSSSFSNRKIIVRDFYLGLKHADQNYLPKGLIWSKFDLHQAHLDEAAIVLVTIIIHNKYCEKRQKHQLF